ncbi:CRE-HCP-4 protein [Caenorhabditis remanei]|uniref:CRE-HCP-4 protein n=1 Tax=Caenorhabditis remanei TaxID=31234 RepID=E3LVZ6_CAERE|nr:CRE-HCP-4 protein [Caenorhabditis remanei]
MERKHGWRSTIVPGRKAITQIAALHDAGVTEDMSYLNEKSVLDESSNLNDTHDDDEERALRKKGFSEREINKRLQGQRVEKLAKAHGRLEEQMLGAKTFKELMEKHEYSERESDDENDTAENITITNKPVFAIPALPKHLSEKSMMGSPVAGTKGSGKAGLSCSTPKSGKDVSMRSLRVLDISHVVNTDQLDYDKVAVHNKNVLIPIVENTEQSSAKMGETFTVRDDQDDNQKHGHVSANEASLQKTFTVDPRTEGDKSESALQKTFTLHPRAEGDKSESSLQKTFTVPGGDQDSTRHSSLQNTFVKSGSNDSLLSNNGKRAQDYTKKIDESVNADQSGSVIDSSKLAGNCISNELIDRTITENTVEGGEQRRRSNKVGVQERERRHADLNSSLMKSMIEEVPSPGANYFKNPRKKLRPTVEVPPKIISRLSVESDKEKTIEMLSMVEEVSMEAESNGPSFVDPLSVNGSRISPIPEVDKLTNPTNVTPKSNRRNLPIRGNSMETVRVAQANDVSSVITPKLNYLKPTISSLRKHVNEPECDDTLFGTRRDRCTPGKSATTAKTVVQDAPIIEKTPVTGEGVTVKNDQRNDASNRDLSTGLPEETNRPSFNLELEVGDMSIRPSPKRLSANLDSVEPADFDLDLPTVRIENQAGPSNQRSSRNRAALLSDSIATVNTPGYNRTARCRVMNNTNVEESWQSDEDDVIISRRNPGKNVGLQLKKREIIQPDTNNGNRRSTRNRVKPLRSWLGEKAVYKNSPSGGKRLTGVTDVVIKDKRLCKYRTADLKLATEREQRAKAHKKELAARKREQLLRDQQAGRRMDESHYDIHTDDEE